MDYGARDGVTLCGPRTYTIAPATYSFLDLIGDTLILQSTNPSDATVIPITINIEAKLVNYPAVTSAPGSFQVDIIQLTCSSSQESYEYQVGAASQLVQF